MHPGAQVGVIAAFAVQNEATLSKPEFEALGKDVCMHAAALSPRYLDSTGVAKDIIASESEIYKSQALAEGKPEKIMESIIQGKLRKFFSEVCLVDQPYVKEDKKSVSQHVEEVGKGIGDTPVILAFTRYKVGETRA
jgi:elongation factor Ts